MSRTKRFAGIVVCTGLLCLIALLEPQGLCKEGNAVKTLPPYVFQLLEIVRNSFSSGFENTLKNGGLGMFLAAMFLLPFKGKATAADRLGRAAIISVCTGSLIPAIVICLVSGLKNFGLDVVFYYFLAIEGYLLIPLAIAFYFLPTIVTYKRGKAKLKKALLLNCFLGFIGPVWTALLVLSFLDDKKPAPQ